MKETKITWTISWIRNGGESKNMSKRGMCACVRVYTLYMIVPNGERCFWLKKIIHFYVGSHFVQNERKWDTYTNMYALTNT